MQQLLAIAACLLALSGGAWADQAHAPNTAAKAAEAAMAFFPAPAGKANQSTSDAALQAAWDVTGPAAAVRRQYRLGLNSLQTGKTAPYLALLAPDYAQPGADRVKTAQKLTEMLARNRCVSARFTITEARMSSADRLTVRVWQEFVFTSKGTPPTYVTAAPGQTYAVINTGRLTVTQMVREDWVRGGAGWQMRRAETIQQKAVAVL